MNETIKPAYQPKIHGYPTTSPRNPLISNTAALHPLSSPCNLSLSRMCVHTLTCENAVGGLFSWCHEWRRGKRARILKPYDRVLTTTTTSSAQYQQEWKNVLLTSWLKRESARRTTTCVVSPEVCNIRYFSEYLSRKMFYWCVFGNLDLLWWVRIFIVRVGGFLEECGEEVMWRRWWISVE